VKRGTADGSGRRLTLAIGLIVGLLGAGVFATEIGQGIEEDIGLAWLFRIRGPLPAPPDVVVVSTDARAARQYVEDHGGVLDPSCTSAPGADLQVWPRCLHARLIDSLADLGASAIVFDIAFMGKSTPEEDAELAAAIRRSRRVVLLELVSVDIPEGAEAPTVTLSGPLLDLRVAALGLAPFLLPKVPARVNQFWTFKPELGDVPTLPVMALQAATLPTLAYLSQQQDWSGLPVLRAAEIEPDDLRQGQDLRRMMRRLRKHLRDRPADADALARIPAALRSDQGLMGASRALRALADVFRGPDSYLLNFFGPAGTIETLSGALFLGPLAERARAAGDHPLAGRVVFVGLSDPTRIQQEDSFHTVFSRADGIDLSGVEIAATAYANLLDGTAVKRLSNLEIVLILLALGFVLGAASFVVQAAIAVGAVLVIAALYFGLAQTLFGVGQLWMPVAIPVLLQVPAALLIGLGSQYLVQKRGRERVAQVAGYYVPEHVVASLSGDAKPSESSELVYGTCMSTDAENYTVLSERLKPEELRALMNEYYETITAPIIEAKGTITDLVADSVMSVWPCPRDDPEARLPSCLTALKVRDLVDRFNERHSDRRLPTRIGLHAGEVAIGNIGGHGHYAYSLVGDIANTTSRIQGLNKYLGTTVLASEAVVDGLESLLVRRIGLVRLVGKSEPLTIYELLAEKAKAPSRLHVLAVRFSEAMALHDQGDWAAAGRLFQSILTDFPGDGPSRFYTERCRRFDSLGPSDDPRIVAMDRK
jgi:adenylate cyclase